MHWLGFMHNARGERCLCAVDDGRRDPGSPQLTLLQRVVAGQNASPSHHLSFALLASRHTKESTVCFLCSIILRKSQLRHGLR